MAHAFTRLLSGLAVPVKPGLFLAVALACGTMLAAGNASAFSLFGIHLWGKKDAENTETVQDPVRYRVSFTLDGGDSELEGFLRRRSQLVSGETSPVDGDLGLLVRARDDLQILVGSLFEKAYYGGLVNIAINGQPISEIIGLPNFDRVNPVPVTVTIKSGPRFTFSKIELQGDASRFNPADFDLLTGTPAYSTTILNAASTITSKLRDEGHPFAEITNREVIANHDNATIDVVIAASAGPTANLGPVAINGSEAVDPDFIRRYSRLKAGEPYSPQTLNDAANRLRKLNTFDSVVINTGDALDDNGQLPTTINVKDGKFRYFGFGATISSIDGAGVEGYWGHRNLFGHAEGLKLEAGVSRIGEASSLDDLDFVGGITFTKPGLFLPSGMFTASLLTSSENPDPYNAKSVAGEATYSYEQGDYNTITGGLKLDYSHIEDAFGTEDYLTFSTPFGFDRDTRNDALNPTEGLYLVTTAEPSYDFLGNTFFTSFDAVASTYFAAGAEDRFVLAGRLGAGTIVGGDSLKDIPANDRFYSGGGGSVRGYAFKGISPRNSDGEETGGRSYIEGSIEARIGVTEHVQIVPFMDAADVSGDAFPDFSDIRASAGLGVRYLTSFGPIRLDVAVPLDRYPGGDHYGIYAGIGQAF